MFRVLLISTYELGRPPFGLASAGAQLQQAGFSVHMVDAAITPVPDELIAGANLIGLYVPMHTATRLALAMLPRLKRINPEAPLVTFGLYAPLNAQWLQRQGVQYCIGGEFERSLVALVTHLSQNPESIPQPGCQVVLDRIPFLPPLRNLLPPLEQYARLILPDGSQRLTGYTEASRGCKHHCRHCPIVPVYHGRFRVVPVEVVLADIARQVDMGARHITFGDPDFFNGPGHALRVVKALHQQFPGLSYDVTIKIEHLLKHRHLLPVLKQTGCALITAAVEALDNRILALLNKGHTREDFLTALALLRAVDLPLNPTFVPFTPWLTLAGYRDFLAELAQLGLVPNIQPIQLAIRLLIPDKSPLLDLPDTAQWLGPFRPELLSYAWTHPDPRMDELQQGVLKVVQEGNRNGESRTALFLRIWELTHSYLGEDAPPLPDLEVPQPVTVPYLTEPWYC